MVVEPKIRGFICTTAHPVGCEKNVEQQVKYVKTKGQIKGHCVPKNVLVIGSSTGYGLASRITAAFGCNANTIGVFFEKEASDKRTATAGWYNTAAFEKICNENEIYAKSINGDAFSDEIKNKTIDLIKNDLKQKIDLVVYSLASPRRTDPKTNQTFNSTLKPIGKSYTNKTVDVINAKVSMVELNPASEEEIKSTEVVMGGDDWQLWIDALINADVLAQNVKTVAYSYIGPQLTYPIYRDGTIGRAKEHLEKTAIDLDNQLKAKLNGRAFVSVNKGLVTQASSAIPVVPLYMSILYKVMKENNTHEGCIEQMYRLFNERLYMDNVPVDDMNRIRLDDLEMTEDTQAKVTEIWDRVNDSNLEDITDLKGYRDEFYKLFGFKVESVDYNSDVNIDVVIPSI